MAKVILEEVGKRFGMQAAVQPLSLSVADGEFVAILGPSGCGKTTLLRMIAGLEQPDQGRIWVGERDVTLMPPQLRRIAMVFQTYALYPQMSIYDNLASGLIGQHLTAGEKATRITDAAEALSLQKLLNRRPHQLSGGQRQRVALGRALVRRPDVFLMDEPLSNLDAQLRMQMRHELRTLHQRLRATIIYVTHDQGEAMSLADRIVIMQEGTMQQVDTPVRIYQAPRNQFVASFVGEPEMNLLPAILEHRQHRVWAVLGEHSAIPLRKSLWELAVPGHPIPVICGVRAENARMLDAPTPEALPSQIDAIEELGHETLVHVHHRDIQLWVRAAQSWHGRCGDTVPIGIQSEHLHVFDRDSGQSLMAKSH